MQIGGLRYAHFVFVENGEIKIRRVHEMYVQDGNSKTHIVKGTKLPYLVLLNTGESHSDKHVAEILLDEKNHPRLPNGNRKAWPGPRDVLHLALGLMLFTLLSRIIDVLAQASQ